MVANPIVALPAHSHQVIFSQDRATLAASYKFMNVLTWLTYVCDFPVITSKDWAGFTERSFLQQTLNYFSSVFILFFSFLRPIVDSLFVSHASFALICGRAPLLHVLPLIVAVCLLANIASAAANIPGSVVDNLLLCLRTRVIKHHSLKSSSLMLLNCHLPSRADHSAWSIFVGSMSNFDIKDLCIWIAEVRSATVLD